MLYKVAQFWLPFRNGTALAYSFDLADTLRYLVDSDYASILGGFH